MSLTELTVLGKKIMYDSGKEFGVFRTDRLQYQPFDLEGLARQCNAAQTTAAAVAALGEQYRLLEFQLQRTRSIGVTPKQKAALKNSSDFVYRLYTELNGSPPKPD